MFTKGKNKENIIIYEYITEEEVYTDPLVLYDWLSNQEKEKLKEL